MGRPLEPGEAESGAKALEAWNWAKTQAPDQPGAWQVLSSQYLYKKYGVLPNNGVGDWQHGSGGGAYGWELKDGDLVPKDRSWFEKYGGLAVTLGVLTAGTASAFLGGGAAAAGGGSSAATGGGGGAAGAAGAAGAGGSSMSIPWGSIISSGASLFGNLFAANQAASGADHAAEIAAASSKYQADLAAKANSDALAFQRGNAENSYLNSEAARKGNYGIFAARERRLGSLGEELGMSPREIPEYAAGVDPGWGNGAAADGSSAPATAGGNPSDPGGINAMLLDNYKKLGVSPTGPGSGPTDIAYMAGKVKETGGLTPGNISYWFGPQGRIAAELAKARGGAGAPAAAATGAPGGPAPTVGATPFMNVYTPKNVPQAIGDYV